MEDTHIRGDVDQAQHDNHPLEIATPSIEVNSNQLDDRTLLDDDGRPNISRTPSSSLQTTTVAEQQPLDTDTSHAKVCCA
ncbi:hypothetical protein G6F42_023334 [Rhizopus arrhizus]|nr:hypothetical protein G6F42_023334 [Rhizopus arrhizus]